MSDFIKVKVYISTQKVGSECADEFDIEKDYWESLSEDEKEDMCKEVAFSMMEWNFEIDEE